MSTFRGAALKILAIACFALMSAAIKAASGEVPVGEAVFFRSSFALPVILLWLAVRGELGDGLAIGNRAAQLARGLFGTMAMGLRFLGLALLPLPEVTALGYVRPLFIVLLAALLLGERVRIVRLSAVVIGFLGVIIILWPKLEGTLAEGWGRAEMIGALAVLSAALCAALAQIFIRKLVATERTTAIVFHFSLMAAGLSLLTVPFGWVWPSFGWVWPSPFALTCLIGAGILGGLGQVALTSSYRFADASTLAPFDYASMLFALAIGYGFFGEWPRRETFLGAALVILGGVLILWRERQLGLKRPPRPEREA